MNPQSITKVPFKIHPRVFRSLGADLVTNNVVAIIELVKNSYDAFASLVKIDFHRNTLDGSIDFIEISDNGLGMSCDTIDNVWCTIATPFKAINPSIKYGEKKRRVSGAKGLGRLATFRLGRRLEMLTRVPNGDIWEVNVDWGNISEESDITNCYAARKLYEGNDISKEWHGTRIRIFDVIGEWTNDMLRNLSDDLGRIISPFSNVKDFEIELSVGGISEKIQPPAFLLKPKYSLVCNVSDEGELSWIYSYSISENDVETKQGTLKNDKIFDGRDVSFLCGQFSFELRAWDLDADGISSLSEEFKLSKSNIRKAIQAHKGISVYRDGILVLPKSEGTKDWLGLDLRRVSQIGRRLSTSQLIGYVSISADKNPNLADTSDRERLSDNEEYRQFSSILIAGVSILENERNKMKAENTNEKPLEELFGEMDANNLLSEVLGIAESGGNIGEAIPLLRNFNTKLERIRNTIQRRMIYYSRLATIGTISQMLVHEIRNRTTTIGRFLAHFKDKFFDKDVEDNIKKSFSAADVAVDSLENLSDKFLPLANRNFIRRKRGCEIKKAILACMEIFNNEIEAKKVIVDISNLHEMLLLVDPADFDAVILNLFSNALYWITEVPEENRKIILEMKRYTSNRIQIAFNDTGPGVPAEDALKILWPGVTRKPNGIGMGLTVSAEIIASYEGKLAVLHPGKFGGASFLFDLPVKA